MNIGDEVYSGKNKKFGKIVNTTPLTVEFVDEQAFQNRESLEKEIQRRRIIGLPTVDNFELYNDLSIFARFLPQRVQFTSEKELLLIPENVNRWEFVKTKTAEGAIPVVAR